MIEKNTIRIMVLAGGNDQAALIKELRHQIPGVFIILIDMLKEVVAAPYADKQYVISTMDLPAVEKCAREENVDYIMTACGDQPLLTMAVVSEKLGLPCYLSKTQVLNLTNKMYMKRLMVENGIPTSRFRTFSDLREVSDTGLEYPLIVKPVDSNGSKGVRKVMNLAELKEYSEAAFKFSLSHTIIVEEFVEGVEVSLDYYISGGRVVRMMSSKLNKYKVDDATQVIYQSVIPSGISAEAQNKLDQIAGLIGKGYGVTNSPLLIQAMVNGDDVKVIEFSARLGGGAKYQTIQNVTGFNVLAANVKSMLGEIPEIDLKETEACYSRTHLYTTGGIFMGIEGSDALLQKGDITEVIVTKAKMGGVNSPRSSSDRVASFFSIAPTHVELDEKIRHAISAIRIIDDHGRDILKRDIYAPLRL